MSTNENAPAATEAAKIEPLQAQYTSTSDALNAPETMPLCSGLGKYHSPDHQTNPKPLLTITLQDIAASLQSPAEVPKDSAPWFIPSTLLSRKHDQQRQNGCYWALWAETDEPGGMTFDEFVSRSVGVVGAELLAYTTRSATEDKQKARIIIPLSRAVSGADWILLQKVLNAKLAAAGVKPDPVNERTGQPCYLPNRGEFYQWTINDCFVDFNPDQWSAELDALKAEKETERLQREQKHREAQERALKRMETGCKSPIDAYNAEFPIPLLFDSFGYLQRGDRWLSPNSSSRSAGVTLTPDGKKWLSAHDSDSGIGRRTEVGSMGDAFDLFTYYEHGGNRDAAVKAAGAMFTQDGLTLTQHNQRAHNAAQSAKSDFSDEDAPNDSADEDVDTPPALVPVDVAEVMTKLPEQPRFVVEPWLPRRVVTLFGGHGGAGKTTLAVAIGAHVAAGENLAGLVVEREKVVVVSLEDEASVMLLRLRRVIEEYSLNHFKVLENFSLLDGTAGYAALMAEGDGYNAPTLPTATFHAMREQVRDAGLIIIDNASDAYDANENSRRAVRSFIRALMTLARENDAAVMLLAHIDKAAAKNGSQGNSYSGSTAWHNSSRSRLALLVQEDGTLMVEHEKLNLGKRADPMPFRLSEFGIPVPEQRSTGAVEGGSFDRQQMIATFRAAEEAGASIPANLAPGAYSAMNALSTLPEYPAKYQRGRQGRTQAQQMLTQMRREGLLVEEEYTKPNRHKSTRLVLAESQKCADPEAVQVTEDSNLAELGVL
jgi:hypothetical protein